MKYRDTKKNPINNIIDWENYIFKSSKKEKHWKVGRSAYSIANFMMNQNGERILINLISDLLSESVTFEKAIPELEIRFDKYGHGREHDLAIFGTTASNKKIFIGLEAKVDETFGEKVSEVYIKAKSKEINGESTNAPKRIEELIKRNFNEATPRIFDLRYQLLYSTVGTLDAVYNDKNTDISVLLIMVFKTHLYDEFKGIENHRDYIQFINELSSERIKNTQNIDLHRLSIGGRDMYSVYINIENK